MSNDLPSIDPAQLEAVTGGTSTDDAVTQMLQQLMSSIQDLAQNAERRQQPVHADVADDDDDACSAARRLRPPSAAPEPPPGDGWIRVA